MISVSVSVTNLCPSSRQLVLESEVVLDNAVVDDDDAAGAVAVGMGIFFRRAAVRGPAGVADAVGSAAAGLLADDFFQIAQLAWGAAQFQPVCRRRLRRSRRNHSRDIRGGAVPRG